MPLFSSCRLLISIDEDDWVKYFSQIPLFSLDSALFCPDDPVFQLQKKFAAKMADPFGCILDLPLKILPLFGQVSIDQIIEKDNHVCLHQAFALEDGVQKLELFFHLLGQLKRLAGLEVNEALKGVSESSSEVFMEGNLLSFICFLGLFPKFQNGADNFHLFVAVGCRLFRMGLWQHLQICENSLSSDPLNSFIDFFGQIKGRRIINFRNPTDKGSQIFLIFGSMPKPMSYWLFITN